MSILTNLTISGVNDKLSERTLNARQTVLIPAVRFVNWFLDRFFTGFVWGFAFMLGLWLSGTLVGLR